MTPDTTIVVRKPADLVDATPYVIGFHPTQSLVVLGLTASRIFFGARHDLPPPDGDAIVHLAAVVAAQRARTVVLLAYGPPSAADPVIRRSLQVFDSFRVRVTEALRVHDGRWWSYFCSEPACCPAEGTPYNAGASLIAAEATYRGQVVLPNRQALVAQVAPVEGEARAAMVAATERACETLQHLITDERLGERAVRRSGRLAVRDAEKRYRSGGSLSDDEVAMLGVLLIDRDVHDYTLERQGDQEWRLALWTDMLRRVEPAYVPAVGSVLGYLAWRAGQGPLARVAIDRALFEDPQHPLTGLLDEVLGLGVGPHAMTALEWPSRLSADRHNESAHTSVPGSDFPGSNFPGSNFPRSGSPRSGSSGSGSSGSSSPFGQSPSADSPASDSPTSGSLAADSSVFGPRALGPAPAMPSWSSPPSPDPSRRSRRERRFRRRAR